MPANKYGEEEGSGGYVGPTETPLLEEFGPVIFLAIVGGIVYAFTVDLWLGVASLALLFVALCASIARAIVRG